MSKNPTLRSIDTTDTTTHIRKSVKRRARVVIPDVTISPRTLRILDENEKFLKKYARRASILFRY